MAQPTLPKENSASTLKAAQYMLSSRESQRQGLKAYPADHFGRNYYTRYISVESKMTSTKNSNNETFKRVGYHILWMVENVFASITLETARQQYLNSFSHSSFHFCFIFTKKSCNVRIIPKERSCIGISIFRIFVLVLRKVISISTRDPGRRAALFL